MTDEDALLQSALDFTVHGQAAFGYVEARDVIMQVLPDAAITRRHFEAPTRFTGAVYEGGGELVRSSLGFSEGEFAPLDPDRMEPGRFGSARRLPCALYGGTLYPILGHFLFETVARLWHGVDLGSGLSRKLPIVFHPWLELDLHAFLRNPLYRRILDALGISQSDIVLADEDLRVDVLYCPSPLSIYHVTLHPLMGHVLDHLAARLTPEPSTFRRLLGREPVAGRRVYLSRSRWTTHRRVQNERAVEELFRRRGFAVVHPQSTEPEALVGLLQGAEIVASTDGSQAHLAAFCRPGTRTLLIDTRPVPTQFAIEKLRRLSAFHIPVYANGLWSPDDGQVDMSGRLQRLVDAALRLGAE